MQTVKVVDGDDAWIVGFWGNGNRDGKIDAAAVFGKLRMEMSRVTRPRIYRDSIFF